MSRWCGHRRSSLVAAALVIILVAAAPQVAGQDATLANAFLDASFTLLEPLDMGAVWEENTVPSDRPAYARTGVPGPTGNPFGCGAGHVTPDVAAASFTFVESQEQNGCALAGFNVTPPARAEGLTVTFSANRTIQQSSAAELAHNFKQNLVLLNSTGGRILELAFFAPDDGPRDEQSNFAFDHSMHSVNSTDGRVHALGFWFDDGGNAARQNLNAVFGQSYSSTVQHARLAWTGIPADIVRLETDSQPSGPGERDETLTITIDVPETPPGRDLELVVRVSNAVAIEGVQAPDGAKISNEALQASEEAGVLTLALSADIIGAHGPGQYIISFEETVPLAVNSVMAPLGAGLYLAALGSGALALNRAHQLRKQAVGRHVGLASALSSAVLLGLAVTVAVLAWLAISGRYLVLVFWPLQAEAVLYLLTAGALIVVFMMLRLRTMTVLGGQMKRDLLREAELRRRVQQSNKELEQYAYVASHDLQEPLRVVAGHVQLIEHQYGDLLDEQGKEYMAHTTDGVRRMKRMLEALLELSRINTGRDPPRPVPLDECLDDALSSLGTLVEETNAQVTRGPLPTVHGDAAQLTQVFQNLIGNAVKFRREGVAPVIHVSAQHGPEGWTVRVKDNGIGIPHEQKERVFRMFQRLHGRGKYEGDGIGLALVARIIHRHGGTVGLRSEPGRGSVFHYTLPG